MFVLLRFRLKRGGERDKLLLKFTRKCKGPSRAKATLKQNKDKGFKLSDIKTYYGKMSNSLKQRAEKWLPGAGGWGIGRGW